MTPLGDYQLLQVINGKFEKGGMTVNKNEARGYLRWDILRTAILNQIIIVAVVFLTIGFLMAAFVVSEIRQNSANIVSAIHVNVRCCSRKRR